MSFDVSFNGPTGPETHRMESGLDGAPRVTNREAIRVQQVTGMKVGEWLNSLAELDAVGMTALVQLLWARTGEQVRFDDVEFDLLSVSMVEVDVAPVEDDGVDPIPLPPN